MFLSLKKDALMAVLQNYSQIVKPNIIRGFENILFTYSKEKQQLCLLGSDSVVALKTFYPEKIELESDLSFCVPGQLLISMVSSLSKQDIKMSFSDNDMIITDGKSKFTLNIINGSEYPSNDLELEGEQLFSVNGRIFKKMLIPSNFCLDNHKVRPALAGMLLNLFSDKVRTVGSDAKEMMELTVPINIPQLDGQPNVKVIAPLNSIRILQKMVDNDNEEVYIHISPSTIGIKYQNVLFQTSTINSIYPEYESKISLDISDVDVTVDKSEMKGLITRALICMEKNDIPKAMCRFENNALTFNGGDGKSKFEETIATQGYSGDERSILLNIRRLKDILSVIETDDVMIKIGSELEKHPLFFVNTKPSDGYSFWTFIMPLRNID
jgi:DNA polymerase III subunit beta